MRATETDPTNYQLAAENVRTNQLDASISLVQVAATEIFTDKVFSVSEEEGVVFDFSMCNPPFFTDERLADEERLLREDCFEILRIMNINEKI